jgi:hypothetical protein
MRNNGRDIWIRISKRYIDTERKNMEVTTGG